MSKQQLLEKRNHDDLNFKVAMEKCNTLKDKLALSNTLYVKAVHVYKKIIDKNFTKSKSIDVMVAAVIYVACRDSDIPCTLNDITKVTGLKKNLIAKYYRMILANLNLQIPVSDITQWVLRIANEVQISNKVKQHAITILDNAKKRNYLAGKEPMGIAAAAIYLASIKIGEKTSQQKLAKISMISDVTIRNRCNGLRSIC